MRKGKEDPGHGRNRLRRGVYIEPVSHPDPSPTDFSRIIYTSLTKLTATSRKKGPGFLHLQPKNRKKSTRQHTL